MSHMGLEERPQPPPEDFQRSRLYRAIRKGDSARVLNAIRRGANIHLYHHDDLSTYLHLAVTMTNPNTEHQFLPMIYILSNYGVEVNAMDIRGKTALELAIGRGLRYIMVALIRVGTDLTDRDYKAMISRIQGAYQEEMLDNFDRFEPGLWGAVKRNNISQTQILLNSWCRINVLKSNKTLINYAMETRKSNELVTILKESEHHLDFVHATLAGDEEKMREYLDQGDCDPDTMDISHHDNDTDMLLPRSLRDTAVAMGHTHVLHLLPEGENNSEQHINDLQHCDNLYDDDVSQFYAKTRDVYNDDDDDNGYRYVTHYVRDNDVSSSEYTESIATTCDVTQQPNLRLDLEKLNIEDDEEDDDVIYSNRHIQKSHIENQQRLRKQASLDSSLRKNSVKKLKNRFYQNGDAIRGKSTTYAVDEGYNSIRSSLYSEPEGGKGLTRSPKKSESCPTFGTYKEYYDNCYYYSANDEREDQPTMMVLTTPRGSQDTLRAGSIKGGSLKGGSVKTKAKKQRARIYWQEDSAGEAQPPSIKELKEPPIPKPRKSKRNKSLRVSRHMLGEEERDDVKSKMCVIQ